MAEIQNLETGKTIFLHAQHTFGRYSNSTTVLESRDISRSHALIHWKSGHWYIQDYSRNGTLLDGRRIHNQTVKISGKSVVQFGNDKFSQWRFVNNEGPSSYLKSVEEENRIIVMSQCTALPSEEEPEILFSKTESRKWKAESPTNTTFLEHRKKFTFNGEEWVFVENEVYDETVDYGFIRDGAKFRFQLSLDEEEVQLKIIMNNMEMDLGIRAHHFLLLTLARERERHLLQGKSSADAGWITMEELAYLMSKELMANVDNYKLNLYIHRIRKQLVAVPPYGSLFTDIVQRRRNEIRFSHEEFEIDKVKLAS